MDLSVGDYVVIKKGPRAGEHVRISGVSSALVVRIENKDGSHTWFHVNNLKKP